MTMVAFVHCWCVPSRSHAWHCCHSKYNNSFQVYIVWGCFHMEKAPPTQWHGSGIEYIPRKGLLLCLTLPADIFVLFILVYITIVDLLQLQRILWTSLDCFNFLISSQWGCNRRPSEGGRAGQLSANWAQQVALHPKQAHIIVLISIVSVERCLVLHEENSRG